MRAGTPTIPGAEHLRAPGSARRGLRRTPVDDRVGRRPRSAPQQPSGKTRPDLVRKAHHAGRRPRSSYSTVVARAGAALGVLAYGDGPDAAQLPGLLQHGELSQLGEVVQCAGVASLGGLAVEGFCGRARRQSAIRHVGSRIRATSEHRHARRLVPDRGIQLKALSTSPSGGARPASGRLVTAPDWSAHGCRTARCVG
jgi:hypothetical protein